MLFREEDENEEMLPFANRAEAGGILAGKLSAYAEHADVVVIGLARGGVSVAFQVAEALHLPLDVLVVRKLGAAWNREVATGALASGGVQVLDLSGVKNLGISNGGFDQVAGDEWEALQLREQLYRCDHLPIPLVGKTVILVDDGIATGCSMLAAIESVRRRQAAHVVVAAPVIAAAVCNTLRMQADEVISVAEPEFLFAISQWYEDFGEVGDQEVRLLLEQASEPALRVA